MQLTLCVKRDLHGCIFLNKLLPQLEGHAINLLLSDKHRADEGSIPALAEMAFLERSLPIDIVFPLIDATLATGGMPGKWLTFNGLAEKYGLATTTVTNLAQLAAALADCHPELIISSRFSLIFTPAMLAIPRHGIINIHPAALPQFAGLFGPMRTLAEGNAAFTCAIHLVDQGIDTGPLLHCESLPVRPGEGLLQQIANIYPLAIPFLLAAIKQLSDGKKLSITPQDKSLRCYRSFPSASEIADFLASGGRFWDAGPYQQLLEGFQPRQYSNRVVNINEFAFDVETLAKVDG